MSPTASGPDEWAAIRAQAARARAASLALAASARRAQACSRERRLAVTVRRDWWYVWGGAPGPYVRLAVAVAEVEGALAQTIGQQGPGHAVDRATARALTRDLRALGRLLAGGPRLRPPLLASQHH